MCDPVTLFGAAAVGGKAATTGLLGAGGAFAAAQAIPTALGVAGFGLSAYGTAYQSEITKQNMLQQAGIMDYRAKVAENDALMAEYAAEVDADNFDLRMRSLMASSAPKTAKSLVVINQDSPLKVDAVLAREAMLERLQILNRGEVEAFAKRTGSENIRSAADRQRYSAGTIGPATGVGLLADAFKTGRSLMRDV